MINHLRSAADILNGERAAKTDKWDAGANGRARDRAMNCERVSNVP